MIVVTLLILVIVVVVVAVAFVIVSFDPLLIPVLTLAGPHAFDYRR